MCWRQCGFNIKKTPLNFLWKLFKYVSLVTKKTVQENHFRFLKMFHFIIPQVKKLLKLIFFENKGNTFLLGNWNFVSNLDLRFMCVVEMWNYCRTFWVCFRWSYSFIGVVFFFILHSLLALFSFAVLYWHLWYPFPEQIQCYWCIYCSI